MLKPNVGFILLFVKNPQRSSHFYKDLLNIQPIEESPTFVMFMLENGLMLGLWSQYTAEPRVEGDGSVSEICFSAEDVDAMYETLGKKQFTVAQKPTDMDFGRTFVILDPDGHRIRIYNLKEAV